MDLTHFRKALDAFPPHLKETCDHVLALKKANPHTEDLWNALYASAQDRYDNEQKEKEANKVSDDSPDTSHDQPFLFSRFSNDPKCFKITSRFKKPGSIQENSIRKEGYVIGIDPEGSDVALVMFTPDQIPHDFIIVLCPPYLLQPHFFKEFNCEKKPDKKLLQEYKLLPLGKCSEMKREEQTDTSRYMISGEFRNLSIDNDLHFSISNGLVSKKVNSEAYVYRIFKERPIWFCEKDTVAVKKIYCVDTAASALQDCVVLKQYLDPVGRRKPCEIVHEIARITKLDLSYEVKGKKKLLKEMQALFASAVAEPTEFDMCLQFALCGEATFFPIGRFGLCKNGHKNCLCDVVKESVDEKVWKNRMKNFRKECKKCDQRLKIFNEAISKEKKV
jgi:hypothetical protein